MSSISQNNILPLYYSLQESKNDLEPLTEVEVDTSSEEDIEYAIVSSPYNVIRNCANQVPYHEIQECLSILQCARENLECYQTFQERGKSLNKICNITYYVYSVGIFGSLLSGAFLIHKYLEKPINEKINLLLMPLSQAKHALNVFMLNYTDAYNKVNTPILNKFECLSKFPGGDDRLTKFLDSCQNNTWPTDLNDPYRDAERNHLKAVCIFVESHPVGHECHQEALCEASKKTIVCWDQAIKYNLDRVKSIIQFHAQYNPEKEAYEKPVQSLQAKIDSYQSENTWENPLSWLFIATCVLTVSCVCYLFFSKKWSYYDYENGSHQLDGCLKQEQMNKIIFLSSRLDITLKGVSIEKLIEEINSKKLTDQQKEASFTLFTILSTMVKENSLPKDIFNLILQNIFKVRTETLSEVSIEIKN